VSCKTSPAAASTAPRRAARAAVRQRSIRLHVHKARTASWRSETPGTLNVTSAGCSPASSTCAAHHAPWSSPNLMLLPTCGRKLGGSEGSLERGRAACASAWTRAAHVTFTPPAALEPARRQDCVVRLGTQSARHVALQLPVARSSGRVGAPASASASGTIAALIGSMTCSSCAVFRCSTSNVGGLASTARICVQRSLLMTARTMAARWCHTNSEFVLRRL
jgi:hypothetical protein